MMSPEKLAEAMMEDEIFRQFTDLEQYNLVVEKPEEYLQLIMQFGYLAMFGPAFPLGAAVARATPCGIEGPQFRVSFPSLPLDRPPLAVSAGPRPFLAQVPPLTERALTQEGLTFH